MNPEEKKNHKGGARLQKPEKPQREKTPRPPRTRQQKVLRVLYIVLTVIAALIVAGFVIFHFMSAPPEVSGPTPTPQHTTVIDENGNEVEVEIPGLSADRKDQFYTFLLVGQDTFGGGNTDTMMLAAYDVPNQTLSVMSLPRDTYVNYNGRRVLLNSVYNRAGAGDDGMDALRKEIGELTGVTPDFYVIVQWEAVGELVDAIDGVYFDVPRRMYYNDLSQDFRIDLQEGYQLLDGDDAMGLLRWRHNSDDSGHILNSGYANGDLGRIQTQQDFMKAVIQKCLQPTVLLGNLLEYINIFQENVVTNLSVGNMAYFAKSAIGSLDMDDVAFMTMPWKDAGDGAHVLPLGSELVEAINDGFNPYVEDITLGDLDLVSRISSGSSGGTSSRPASTPAPAATPEATPDATPSESPSTQPGMTPVPDATPAPGGTDPGAVPTPPAGGESTPPATDSPAATDVPADNPAESAAPAQDPVPETVPPLAPEPAADPNAGVYGPGMEPIE